jgi:phosphoglycolate phosphatase-like HAD superfamily hydrolase
MTSESDFDWRRFDAYLFDIDGTLLNCRDGVHYNAFHAALRQVWNCQVRIENVPVHGNTDVGILHAATQAMGLAEKDFAKGVAEAIAIMQSEVERTVDELCPELCPSIAPLVQRLHAERKVLGIVSGNLEPIGWAKLHRAGLAPYFSFGSFSGRNESRVAIFTEGIAKVRHRLGPAARICFVGDTPADILAAKALNTPLLAVATGIYSLETLREYRPDYCSPFCDLPVDPEQRSS